MAETKKFEIDRITYAILFKEKAGFKDTYAGAMDSVFFDAMLLRPKDKALRKRYLALIKELKQSNRESSASVDVDYRQDTRWSDLEDDFDHSTYP